MTEILKGTVEKLDEVIERWLEYGMPMPIIHEHAVNLVPACIMAINEVNNYNLDTLIELPKGVSIIWGSTGETTNMCPAYVIMYRFDLTNWLKKGWNIKKHEEQLEKENSEMPNSE